ncbi:MAG: DMT family transporter [Bacillota bacterium]
MAWFYLIVASIFEISWAVGLKYSAGLTKPVASVFTVITMILSFVFLSQAAKSLPIGTAYVIWTGIGAAGTALYGMLFFGEAREVLRIVFLLVIITGVLGLKFTSK